MITNGFVYATFLFFFAGIISTLERKYRKMTFFKYVPSSVILFKSARICGSRVSTIEGFSIAKVLSVMAGA
ncbi:hypothetical protein MASR2M79_03110 [Aminivibrio sp.]